MKANERNLFLIAGPCSAESHEQLFTIAQGLYEHCRPDIFRAGVWKARTRLNTYEGPGTQGLQWLAEIQSSFHLPVATEVHDDKHVELCFKHNIKVMWLGARTVVNSYITQRIADAVQNTDCIILVKNPISPDVELWKSAIERFLNAHPKKVIGVHRGFYTSYRGVYRNEPFWDLALEIKRTFPNLPLLCDPSHICGRTSCILPIMQTAVDLEYDGFMIEIHHQPEQALSDQMQQITPEELASLMSLLLIRGDTTVHTTMLDVLRKEIDHVDYQLIELLATRMELVKQIGQLKKNLNMTILQNERFRFVFADRVAKGMERGLQKNFLKQIIRVIHNEAIRLQMLIYSNQSSELDNSS